MLDENGMQDLHYLYGRELLEAGRKAHDARCDPIDLFLAHAPLIGDDPASYLA